MLKYYNITEEPYDLTSPLTVALSEYSSSIASRELVQTLRYVLICAYNLHDFKVSKSWPCIGVESRTRWLLASEVWKNEHFLRCRV